MPPLVERLIDAMHDVGKAAVLSKATDAEIVWLFCGQNLPPEEEFEAVMAQTMQLLSMTVLGKYRKAAQRALRLDEAHINKKNDPQPNRSRATPCQGCGQFSRPTAYGVVRHSTETPCSK